MIVFSKLLQSLNAYLSIEVILLGILTHFKLAQPEKAPKPIDVTLLGIDTDVIELHPLKV